MSGVVWAQGRMLAPGEAVIRADDHGFTVGDGLFETIAVRDGLPFALTRHLSRLSYGAERMGIDGIDMDEVREGIAAVVAADAVVTRVRVTVTSGPGPAGYGRGDSGPTVVITGGAGERPRLCHAVRAPWKHNERSALAGIKTTSAGEYAVIAAYARSKGADEAILANTYGNLCEGTSTNVFLERGGEIVTPPLASGCLPGIARGLALEWGAKAGIPVRVGAPGELTLASLDEVIAGSAHMAVTSVIRGVQHVSSLDGEETSAGTLLRDLAAHFELQAERNPDPALPRRK
ncbi:aminotransferase class IV [Demequina sp. B12]|uniref:aminotransferase class IV n=1 Tax=Demequina sp. B12 TaxID=2992757 RepID=UPI00237A477B|nr:aminotransferase class IV [Demequina sp. B12]MDE0573009.1 aminotransferase class IV [Demequina sp. B12]